MHGTGRDERYKKSGITLYGGNDTWADLKCLGVRNNLAHTGPMWRPSRSKVCLLPNYSQDTNLHLSRNIWRPVKQSRK